MPTVLSQLDAAFRRAIRDAFGVDTDPILTVSQNEKFGDYQSNAAMGLAKQLKSKPQAVAGQIKEKLDLGEMAAEITIAGPGFINVRLSPAWLAMQLQSLASDNRLGLPRAASPQTVVVDYSGPNIAKEMHVGHLRSTIIGDAIARIVEFQGDTVIRQNHIGDWGTQFGMLIANLKIAMLPRDGKPHGGLARPSGDPFEVPKITDLEAFYRSAKIAFDTQPTFADEARACVVRLQSGAPEEYGLWQGIVEATRTHFEPVYQQLAVKLGRADERGESTYNSELPKVVNDLKQVGIAIESEGAIVVFIDGPDKTPLIIQKSDGGYLYGTTDLAAIRYRVDQLHANRIIYVHDSRQAQHFSQVFRTAQKASWTHGEEVKLEYAPFGTMLGEDGKPFKSRSGDLVKLKELLNEAEDRALKIVTEKNTDLSDEQRQSIAHAVGIGAVKYADLSKDRISDYVFSWDKMLAMDGNTAPYLQYAHARIKSIFRKAGTPHSALSAEQLSLDSPFEVTLAKHVLRLCEIVDLVPRELKPHHLCTYLYELSTKFSSFYENCPVIQSEEPLRSSRLLLCDVTAKTLALGLDLLGIEHPEKM